MIANVLSRTKLLSAACLVLCLCACSRRPEVGDRPPPVLEGQTAEVFTLPRLFEVALPGPDRWEAVTNARRLDFSPPAVLLLFGKNEPALIRFSLYESAGVTPRGLLDRFRSQLETAGYRCRPVAVAVRDDDPASLVFTGPEPESRRGKIFIERLPGNPAYSVVLIGQWAAASDAPMTADFDAIAASVKAVK